MSKKKLREERERCCGFVALRRMNPQAARQPSQKTTIFLTSTLMQPQHTHTHTLEAYGSKDIYGLRGVNSPTSSDL